MVLLSRTESTLLLMWKDKRRGTMRLQMQIEEPWRWPCVHKQ